MGEISNKSRIRSPGSTLILEAFRRVVRPFIRLLLRNRIGFQACARIVKEEYVKIAGADTDFFPTGRIQQTHSNISLLTGINRRDVKDLLNTQDELAGALPALAETAVTEAWQFDPIFSEDGKARILPIRGKGRTFMTLVARHGKNVSYGPILDSLVSAGCVSMLPGGNVRLDNHIFTPKLDDTNLFDVGAVACARIANTFAHNLKGTKPLQFQKEIWSVACPADNVNEFIEASHSFLTTVFKSADQLLEANFEELPATADQRVVGIGLYTFTEPKK